MSGTHSKFGIVGVAAGLVIVLALLVLLKIGQGILLPVIAGLLSIYVVNGAARAMLHISVLRKFSEGWRGFIAILGLALIIVALSIMLTGSIQNVIAAAPEYETRLLAVFSSIADHFGADAEGLWKEIQARIGEWIDIQGLLGVAFGSLSNIGSLIFMSILYAFFMLTERPKVKDRLLRLFGDRVSSDYAIGVIRDINDSVTLYLGLKTLINMVLGILSYIVLVFFDVDFALLWALLIGLLNFIPYVGSYLGVAFPVILSIAQFGNVVTPVLLCICLTLAQMLIGNIVEPRLMGKRLNLSPFVILLSLAIWSALWGIPGAILAVPMTSVVAIIASHIEALKWIAILLADDVGHVSRQPDTSSAES